MAIELSSVKFKPGGRIPPAHTGEGKDLSPPLEWSGLPPGTKELALIVDDPDAPTSEPFVHWVLYGVPADASGLPEGLVREPQVHDGVRALQGTNSFGKTGYNGPLPPRGHGVHHYHFKLYALDRPLELPPGADKEKLLAAMAGHVLGEGEMVGTYER
jgi:Raf kinase inhibitor-like YbhB/YbcL family protein